MLEPSLSPRIAGGLLAEGDAQADPQATVLALAAAASEVAYGHEVHTIEHDGERVTGVSTSHGTISCDRVVVAAGRVVGRARPGERACRSAR